MKQIEVELTGDAEIEILECLDLHTAHIIKDYILSEKDLKLLPTTWPIINVDSSVKQFMHIILKLKCKEVSHIKAAYACVSSGLSNVTHHRITYIRSLVVRKNYRNHKVGSTFVNILKNSTDTIFVESMQNVVPFWTKLGFRAITTTPILGIIPMIWINHELTDEASNNIMNLFSFLKNVTAYQLCIS